MSADQSVVYLVRHGETTWNRDGRLQGHLDSELTPAGVEQARAIGEILRREISQIKRSLHRDEPAGPRTSGRDNYCRCFGDQSGHLDRHLSAGGA